MKFIDYAYTRPNLDSYKAEFTELLQQFKNATTAQEQTEVVYKINKTRSEFDSMYTICGVRHSINTNDEFYKEENDFFDQRYPETKELINEYYRALLGSKFRKDLEAEFGAQVFIIAELSLKTFEPKILEDMKAENKLNTQYRQLKARAKLNFRGKEYNLSNIRPFEISKDRQTRKEASEIKWGFYAENGAEVEKIYHEMVQLRHSMAQKLGYKNYVGLGYARMQRSDYSPEMVANFRRQVQEYIVPIATKLYEQQKNRLGWDSMKYYDEDFKFESGNPTPKGEAAWMEKQAQKMYAELSTETDDFFSFMVDRGLMDLNSKDGKETGGYCCFISNQQSPFIFSNFNGTSHDVEVLTHEAGHAFQCYETSRSTSLYEYLWPTYEACEIHSMSMEFFTWPWMDLFFKEDAEKFKYAHLTKAIQFMPYGVSVDEFQHVVYENPNMTTAERNAAWRAIEKKYLPHRDYDGNEFLESGGWWQRQSHIFGMPFYYIDYVLAQICAFQFWKRSREEKEKAWADYIKLCKTGGSHSFLKLVEIAGLRSPFEDGCVESIVGHINDYLSSVDDSQF